MEDVVVTFSLSLPNAQRHSLHLPRRVPWVEDIIRRSRRLQKTGRVILGNGRRADGGCFPALKAPEPAPLTNRAASSQLWRLLKEPSPLRSDPKPTSTRFQTLPLFLPPSLFLPLSDTTYSSRSCSEEQFTLPF